MNNAKNFEKLCWKNFEKTGKINYYLLMKNFEKQQKEELIYGKLNNNKSFGSESNTFSR